MRPSTTYTSRVSPSGRTGPENRSALTRRTYQRGSPAGRPLSEVRQQPGRRQRGRPDAVDPRVERTVGRDHDGAVALLDGLRRLRDDRRVAVLRGVHGAHVGVLAGPDTALGLALEDEHDDVVGHVGDEELVVQPQRGARAVLPPAVGAGP